METKLRPPDVTTTFRVSCELLWHACDVFIVLIRSSVLTVLFCGLVVDLADESPVLHQVKLVSGGQLSAAHHAGKTVQVINEVLRFTHHLRGGDALLARRALRPKTPAEIHTNTAGTCERTWVRTGHETGTRAEGVFFTLGSIYCLLLN